MAYSSHLFILLQGFPEASEVQNLGVCECVPQR